MVAPQIKINNLSNLSDVPNKGCGRLAFCSYVETLPSDHRITWSGLTSAKANEGLSIEKIRGPPLDNWGGVPWHFYLFHKGDGKLYVFHLGCISTMPCHHLYIFHPFFHKKCISKKLQFPPPSILMGAPFLTYYI